jgi:hypothetical protein
MAADVAKGIAARPGWKALLFPQIAIGAEPYNHLGGKTSFPGSYPVRASTIALSIRQAIIPTMSMGAGWRTCGAWRWSRFRNR